VTSIRHRRYSTLMRRGSLLRRAAIMLIGYRYRACLGCQRTTEWRCRFGKVPLAWVHWPRRCQRFLRVIEYESEVKKRARVHRDAVRAERNARKAKRKARKVR